MSDTTSGGWEPRNMGNWAAMFDRDGDAFAKQPAPPAQETLPDDGAHALDLADYRPWILQRARTHPALMLELRTYQSNAGLWTGAALAYAGLHAIDFVGTRLLSLDFGERHYAIEGQGLDELARHLQQGTVLTLLEYAAPVWPERPSGPIITAIRRVGAGDAPPR